MQDYLESFLTAFLFLIGITGLQPKPLKTRYLILLWGYYFFIACFATHLIEHFVAELYIHVSIIIILIRCLRPLVNIFLYIYGYLLLVMVSYLYTFLFSLFGLSNEIINASYMIPFLILEIATISLIVWIIRMIMFHSGSFFILEIPTHIQFSFFIQMLLGIGAILTNIILGYLLRYPSNVLAFNGFLISFLVLSSTALFYSTFQLLHKNYELSLKQQEEKALNNYLERMEAFYEEICSFRHDYKNILATLRCYIDNMEDEIYINNNFEILKNYFMKTINPSALQLSNNEALLWQLHNMKIPEIKSILYTKLLLADSLKLHITLEIKESIAFINMDLIKLSRVVGILLDNSIEAAGKTRTALLHIAVIDLPSAILFVIENSTLPITVPLTLLAEKGKTTKENHNGLGLYNVRKITDNLSNVFFNYTYDKHFSQTLEIGKEIE